MATLYQRRHRRRGAPGGLSGLEGAATGIPAVDEFIANANQKAERLVLATEIGTVCSVIGAVAGLMMIFGRRGRS